MTGRKDRRRVGSGRNGAGTGGDGCVTAAPRASPLCLTRRAAVHLQRQSRSGDLRIGHARSIAGGDRAARIETSAGARHAAAGGRGRAARRQHRRARDRGVRRCDDAHAGGGDGPGDGDRSGPECGWARGGWRRLDDWARQGHRVANGPAADRRADHLCGVGDDTDSRRDPGRREDDPEQPQDPARTRHLRCRPDAHAPGSAVGDERHQCGRPRGRGALCPRE